MVELVSELLTPRAGTFHAAAMARGEPGLPSGFTWRDEEFDIQEVLESWKDSSPEGGRHGGELYLRRHFYKLRMSGGLVWTVYFTRQTPRTGSPKARWFLYTIG